MILQRLAFAATLWTAGSAFAATPLTHVVPEDAPLVIALHDTPALLAKWEKSPWAKTWTDEQVKKFFGPLRSQMKLEEWNTRAKEETGYTVEELLAFATGDALLVINDFSFVDQGANATPSLLIAVDVGENQGKIEELFEKGNQEGKYIEETTDFDGVAVHSLLLKEEGDETDKSPTVWAVVDGKWLVSPSKDTVIRAIDAVKSSGLANAWGRSERFARLQKRSGDAHLTLVLNVESLYPMIVKAMEARNQAQQEQPQQGMAFDGVALLNALGLNTLRDVYFTATLADESTLLNGGITYTEERGLLKLLAYKEGPLETPDFVSPKWVTASTSKFSIKDAFTALEEILEAFNPAISGLVQGQIRGLNKELGIDIKRDFFGSLGENIITATTVSPNTPNGEQPGADDLEQLFVVSLENADAFSGALEAFKRKMGPQAESLFKTRDYLGEKIVSFESPTAEGAPKQKSVSYSIAKNRFFLSVGSAAPVESALQGLSGDRPSLWQEPEVKEAMAAMPSGAISFQYQDTKAVIATAFQSLASAAAMMGSHDDAVPVPVDPAAEGDELPEVVEGKEPPIDPAHTPDPATIARYWSHAWGYVLRESTGIHGTSVITYPK